MVQHYEIILPQYSRGFHLITNQILASIPYLPNDGILHLFINHTSAALTINENADPSVRFDFNSFFNRLIPEGDSNYTHIFEGKDDMPAHIKASIIGTSISIPIQNNSLKLGIWQGIYFCEFRNNGGSRMITASIIS